MYSRLFWIIIAAAGQLFSVARSQDLVTLCTEEALRTVVAIGGNYIFGCSTTLVSINLTQPLVVERDLSLDSTQEVLLNGQGNTRIFIVRPGVRLTLNRILIFSGSQTPTNQFTGGIDDTAGAGIYNDGGIVTILNGRFEANSVVGVSGRIGVDNDERDGESGGDAIGGAIYNKGGQITISNTVFNGNNLTGGLGGAGADSDNRLSGNGGDGGNGGSSAGAAIYSSGGSVRIKDTLFTNNVATGSLAGAGGLQAGLLGFPGEAGEAGEGIGAAITGVNAEIIIHSSTFVTNSVWGAAGLPGHPVVVTLEGEAGRDGGEGAGGAIYSTGSLAITNSTFFGNRTFGGNGGDGGAAGERGFGKDGGDGGSGGEASGGAVESYGPATIINCTFSDNVSTGGLGAPGGAGAGVGDDGRHGNLGLVLGGAVHAAGGETALGNNILANFTPTVTGHISDLGANLTTDLNVLINSTNSLRLVNPFLRPLGNYGGLTPTMMLQSNSPAIDRALRQYAPPMDQRGTNRVTPDIGAVEGFTFSVALPPIPDSVLINGFSTFGPTNNLWQLSWPAGYTNLFAQFKTNLSSTQWSTVTNATLVSNNTAYSLTINLTNTPWNQAYFRLLGITNLSNTNLLSP